MNQRVSEPICSSVMSKLAFDLLLNAGENIAIDVVDEVQCGKEHKGGGGSCEGGVC